MNIKLTLVQYIVIIICFIIVFGVSYWRTSFKGEYKENFTVSGTDLNSLNPLDLSSVGIIPDALVFYSVRGMATGITIKHIKATGETITIAQPSADALIRTFNKDEVNRIRVAGFNIGDRIEFSFIDLTSYNESLKGLPKQPSYENPGFVALIYWNGVYYPSNLKNYNARRSGDFNFKRLGCYTPLITDRNFTSAPISPADAKLQKFNTNPLNCAKRAREADKQFFAISGGQCYFADELYQLSIVNDGKCESNTLSGNSSRTTFDTYDAKREGELRECGGSDVQNFTYPGMNILRNKVNARCSSPNTFLFVAFEPRTTPIDDAGNIVKRFCPDPDYAEFDGAGCSNPESYDTCTRSVNRAKAYVDDQNACITPLRDYFSGIGIDINIPDIIQYVINAYRVVFRYEFNSQWRDNLKNGLKKILKASCHILQIDEEYFDLSKCMGNFTSDTNTSFARGVVAPEAVGAIMKAGNRCQMDSENYDHQSRAYCQEYSDALRMLYHWARVVMANVYAYTP